MNDCSNWIAARVCILIFCVAVLFGCSTSEKQNPPTSQFLYAADQDGITVFSLNASTGVLGTGSQATSSFVASNPLANMLPSPNGKFLFACGVLSSSIETFSINAKNGMLAAVGSSALPAQGSCTLSIDSTGKFLYTATSAGISAFIVDSNTGVSSSIAGSPFTDGSDLREAAIDPSGNFLFAISNNTNTISVFAINSSTGALTPIAGSPFQMPVNGTAYSIVVHPSGKFLYVSFPQTEQIAAWSVNVSTGTLTPISGSPFPSAASTSDAPNTLLVTPSGGFLYALSGGVTIFGFSIDANSGTLNAINGSPFALSSPTDYVATDSSGQFVYAAYNNNIAAFDINAPTGTWTPLATSPISAVTLLTVVKPSP
jgi:6-phosphogluconolactonase (cycloisomerase 2 family)